MHRTVRLAFMMAAVASLASSCGTKPPPDSAENGIQAASKLFDDILRWLDDEDAKVTRDTLCVTIDLAGGDLSGAIGGYGQGTLRVRSAALDWTVPEWSRQSDPRKRLERTAPGPL